MNNFVNLSLLIGSIVIIIGLAIILISLALPNGKRANPIATGVVMILVGISIIWLVLHDNSTFHINTGLTTRFTWILFLGFIFGLFILRGVLSIRESSKQLKNKKLSKILIYKNRVQLIVGVIGVTIMTMMFLLLAFAPVGN